MGLEPAPNLPTFRSVPGTQDAPSPFREGTSMKVGVNLINFGPGVTPESLASTVALVEALGYHFVMTSDHVAVTSDVSGRYPAPLYEPFTLLGWLAAATRTMEIGTTVIVLPYRHPLE